MRTFCKRGVSLFLALVMLVGLLSGLALAEGEDAAREARIEQMGKNAVSVALAYFNKGHSVQYNGKAVVTPVHRFDGGDSISTNGVSPEFATPHETMYTVCSDFVHQVYWEAFRFDLLGRGAGYVATSTLTSVREPDPNAEVPPSASYAPEVKEGAAGYDDFVAYNNYSSHLSKLRNSRMLVWYHDPAVKKGEEVHPTIPVKQETTEEVVKSVNDMLEMAQPGDIFTAYSMKYNKETGAFSDVGGHSMFYAGDVTGDGKPDIIHSGGKHMTDDYIDRREYVSVDDPYYKKDLDYYTKQFNENSKDFEASASFGATTNGGSIRISDARDYISKYAKVNRRMTLLRPARLIEDMLEGKYTNGNLADANQHGGKALDLTTVEGIRAAAEVTEYRAEHPGLTIDRTLNKTRFNSAYPGETVTLTLELTNNWELSYNLTGDTGNVDGDGTDENGTGGDTSTETEEPETPGGEETASLQSVGASATVFAAANTSAGSEVKAELQTETEIKKPDFKPYDVTVTEKVPKGAKLVGIPEGATVAGDVITWDVTLEPGVKKTLTAEFKITAALGDRVVFDGGFVGKIPSNSIPIQVGGAKLTEEQQQKLADMVKGAYAEELSANGANNVTLGKVVYEKILGVDALIPEHTTVRKFLTAVNTIRKRKEAFQFLRKDQVAAGDLPAYNTLVQNCWGGAYIWNRDIPWDEFAYYRCSNPNHLYLEPGDIVVSSNIAYKASTYSQLVYLGEGNYLSYDTETQTYPIVSDRAFYKAPLNSVFYVIRPSLLSDKELDGVQNWSLNLNDNIVVNYYLKDAKGMFTNESYATVDGEQIKLVKDGENWYAPIGQKAAKEMGEQSTIYLTAVDKDGKEYYGMPHTVSVRDYAVQMLDMLNWNDNKQAKLGRTMIGMLNYGAAAQEYFKHNVKNLANESLTEADQEKMTVFTPDVIETLRNEQPKKVIKTDNDGLYYASTCVLGSSQALRFYLRLPESRQDRAELNYTVRYTSYNGKKNTVTKSFADLVESSSKGIFYFEVPNMAAADVRTDVTLTVTKGEETLATVTDSIASYCARVYTKNASDVKLCALVDAVLVYGLSARDYFFETTQLGGEENEMPIA